jgi:hypothetical protein
LEALLAPMRRSYFFHYQPWILQQRKEKNIHTPL